MKSGKFRQLPYFDLSDSKFWFKRQIQTGENPDRSLIYTLVGKNLEFLDFLEHTNLRFLDFCLPVYRLSFYQYLVFSPVGISRVSLTQIRTWQLSKHGPQTETAVDIHVLRPPQAGINIWIGHRYIWYIYIYSKYMNWTKYISYIYYIFGMVNISIGHKYMYWIYIFVYIYYIYI